MAEQEINTEQEVNKSVSSDSAEDVLKGEIASLESILNDEMKAREKSLNVGMKVRIGLLIFAFCYCSFLYSLAHGLTAEQAFLMMRGQLDAQLPTMKQEAIDNMKKSAPEVVDSYAKNMIASIPSMRQNLQAELIKANRDSIRDIEVGLNEMCSQALAESKIELDKMGGNMTTAQKIDRLSKEMKIKMFEESREVVDGIAKEYTGKIKEVTNEIKRLQTSKNLTAKEKRQKELLRISSKLMQMKLKDVNKDFQKVADELSKGNI